jgi:hypothetical protein
MSTATDTTQPPNKRMRFASNNDTLSLPSSNNNKIQPPKALAESFIRSSIASLHPIIATDVEKLGKEHIILLSKLNHLQKANTRLVDDTELIPSSARIKFELSVSERVKEMPEYKALQEETVNIIQEAHKDLKIQIIAASKLEIKAITKEIQRHLAIALRLITNSFLLLFKDNMNVDEAVYILAKNYIIKMTKHTPMSLDEFIIIYKEVHTIATFPPRSTNTATTTTTPASNNPTVSQFFQGGAARRITRQETNMDEDQEESETIEVGSTLKLIQQVFENVFILAWSRFLEQQNKNEISIALKKHSSTFFTARSTSDATAAVDAEPAADKKELKTLIRLATINENKNLMKQLNDLKKELVTLKSTSKNSIQGGNGSASVKQNKSNPPVTKMNSRDKKKRKPTPSKNNTGRNNNKKDKVDVNNNANDSGAKNSKNKNGRRQSNKNGKPSSNKKRQQNNRSAKK